MTNELVKLTGRGYLKCLGHTGLDEDPNDWKLLQLEAMLPLFMRNELNSIFRQKVTGTGLFYKPVQWWSKEGKEMHPFKASGLSSLWNSAIIQRETDYKVAIEEGVHPLQAGLLLPQLLEYVTCVTEPLSLDRLVDVIKRTDSLSPDSAIVAKAIASFCNSLWPTTMEKELF